MFKNSRFFLGFFLTLLWPGLSLLHAAESSPDAALSQKVAPSEGEASGIDGAIKTAQQEVRDPFVMNESDEVTGVDIDPEAATPIPTLEGIGFGSKDGYAVMGGDVFLKGDLKKGIKLLEVRRREVDILVDGGKVTLPLFPGDEVAKARERAEKENALENEPEEQSSETSASLEEQSSETLSFLGREQPPS